MLLEIIFIIVILAIVALWFIFTQRKLVVLDENISNAMSQIGVQLSSQFDALMALLDLIKDYSQDESEALIETIKSQRSVIMAKSTPSDLLKQEGLISEVLVKISIVSDKYPELKTNPNYIKRMNAVEVFGKMIITSRLVYNDSVTKLNREIRMFPLSMIAGILGFSQKDYLGD